MDMSPEIVGVVTGIVDNELTSEQREEISAKIVIDRIPWHEFLREVATAQETFDAARNFSPDDTVAGALETAMKEAAMLETESDTGLIGDSGEIEAVLRVLARVQVIHDVLSETVGKMIDTLR